MDQDNINQEEIIYEGGEDGESVKDKLDKLKKKLVDCQKEKEEYLTGWQRAQADSVNYRRRQEEQMADWQKLMNEKLINDLLPVLDSLDKGKEIDGVRQIYEQLRGVLRDYGLEEIKAVGEKFNPEFHEAMAMEESANKDGGEMVSEEFQRGYILNGRVIRTAKVKLNKK